MTDCPECGRPLEDTDGGCGNCGWPHKAEEQGAETSTRAATSERVGSPARAGAGAAAGSKPTTYLAVGLGVGLLLGYSVGVLVSGPGGAAGGAAAGGDPARAPGAPAGVSPTPVAPQPLRLRELGWAQTSDTLCTGRFEVVSAPADVRVLRFAVKDVAGAKNSSDSVRASKPIKPGTVLELGFEIGKCSTIDKWQVEVPDDEPSK